MKSHQAWPELNYQVWKPTGDTLQRWLQIVGKVRTHLSPWVNHGWQSTFYVSSSGLTTSLIPHEQTPFSIEFDFIRHELKIETSDGLQKLIPLEPQSVARFYERLLEALGSLNIEVHFSEVPDEVTDRTPFRKDTQHNTYDLVCAQLFWQALVRVHGVMAEFRSEFAGKCSPIHFFWGGMDLACSRFSGRRAPEHPGHIPALSDLITKEAYSHEVSSCGFWPGNEIVPYPAFYSYAYPAPKGFENIAVPEGAFFHETLKEFVLPYDRVRNAQDGEELLLSFFHRTYEGAARLGKWDRDLLENGEFLIKMHQRHQTRGSVSWQLQHSPD